MHSNKSCLKSKEEEQPMTNEIVSMAMADLEKNSSSYNKIKHEKIIQNAVHWSLVNGFVIVPTYLNSMDMISVTHLPFTLFPTPFKREHFNKVWNLQPTLSEIVYKLAKSQFYLDLIFKE